MVKQRNVYKNDKKKSTPFFFFSRGLQWIILCKRLYKALVQYVEGIANLT